MSEDGTPTRRTNIKENISLEAHHFNPFTLMSIL